MKKFSTIFITTGMIFYRAGVGRSSIYWFRFEDSRLSDNLGLVWFLIV